MDQKLVESYLDNIAELVVDEDKIVTYKTLSKSLGIHVNTAKQLLSTYLTKEKSKKSFPISATYLLAGKVKDGSFNISIINEVDLKSTYSKFVEITSEHVYSIQKGKSLKELKVLCGIDKDSTDVASPSVIKCSKSILKSREVKKKPESREDKTKKVLEKAFAPTKDPVPAVEQNKKADSSENKETTEKSPVKKSSTKKSPKGNSSKAQTEAKIPAGSIANLFAKAALKQANEKNNDKDSALKQKQKEVEPSSAHDNSAEKEDLKTESKNIKKSTESKESSKKRKKGSKRKRIQMLSDSEDSESNIEEKSPVKEDSPVPFASIEEDKDEIKESMPKNKRKKRKVVDRTVMNEDGYLETKKEVVFETDSENEVQEERQPDLQQKKAKVAAGNEKGKGIQSASTAKKQTSLLSFFKKS